MRGLGATLGVAVLGAVAVWLLQRIAENSVPAIGDFIAEIVEFVRLRVN